MTERIAIGAVGNPNCGKTTLFNALTGARQEVGNWPGVTVERKVGRYRHDGRDFEVVDLPGVYSLGATIETSEDERVARDFVLAGEAGLIVNIVDASNLERNLYLTTQLLEMRVPMIVVLNMMDIATRRGIAIDVAALSQALGCPVLDIVAARGKGIASLKVAIDAMVRDPRPPLVVPAYGPDLDDQVTALAAKLGAGQGDRRWRALKLIEGDALLTGEAGETVAAVEEARKAVETTFGDEADIAVADARFGFIGGIVRGVLTRPREASRTFSDRVDRVVLNRVLGIPLFLGMMYLTFVFTISIGGAFIDFFDQVFGAVLVDGGRQALEAVGMPEFVVALVADGIGGGIQTMATFVPVIACLYLALAVLEDSGYMARAAFVMDRGMRLIGLPGKSFVPLLVGFGCNVPAIMATRTLDSRHDRLITIMMAPFMSCGARLPVYALFAAAFFPANGQNVVFLLYVIGLVVAIGTGLLLKSTVLRGDASPFIMELPPYHMPTFRNVGLRAWERLRTFVIRCSKVIVPIVVVLSFLNGIGTDGTFGNQDSEKSVLSEIGRTITPLFEPMGMREENWPAAVGVFTGILAKEAVIGTLNTLYARMGGEEAAEEEAVTIGDQILAAFATIPANLAAVFGSLDDPLGLDVSYTEQGAGAAEELEVTPGAFAAMAGAFDGAAGAFAYLLMVLLYMPCVAAMGAIYQEAGRHWALFAAGWTTGIGWCAAVVFYQAARIAEAPVRGTIWIAVCFGLLGTTAVAMRLVGRASAGRGLGGACLRDLEGARP